MGLIYGPSGCGKSSLVKAGLLPRLSDDVLAVYVEATGDETESRLLHGLRKRCPTLSDKLSLKETLAALRRGQGLPAGKKLLIVLDQFEQWLHARNEEENTELVQALRQCDGGRVQCIIMVRDDFWMAATRFMRALEVRLVEAQNSAAVDLFPVRHAEKVLAAFGRAFGALPEGVASLSQEQHQFLEHAVAGLAQEGKVVCVRLALFADMMKGKAWTPATLKDVGGTAGVGVTFLEETFSAANAPPEHRYHQKAARGVLKALLPPSGTDIKGHMRSYTELRDASGYSNRPSEFDDLIRILDNEIRLITPTDPEGRDESESVGATAAGSNARYYQLTHDYLVPNLRDWLTRKQKESRRGRAELLLDERAATWNARRENRFLPSLIEFLNIRFLAEKRRWTEPQQGLMRKAGRVHATRTSLAVLLLAIVATVGLSIHGRIEEQRENDFAGSLVERLTSAEIALVPGIVKEIEEHRRWADPLLVQTFEKSETGSIAKLHAALALLPGDNSKIAYLRKELLSVKAAQFPVVRNALEPHRQAIAGSLWDVAVKLEPNSRETFQAACALATYAPDDERWPGISASVVDHLLTLEASELVLWRTALRPARKQLLKPLSAVYGKMSAREQARTYAAETLADYAADAPETLYDLLANAEPFQVSTIYRKVAEHRDRCVALGQAELETPADEDASEEAKETLGRRQANVAVALLKLGAAEPVWKLLKHSPDPRARSYVIHWLGPLGADPRTIVQRFDEENDVTIRRALLLALGEFTEAQFPQSDRPPWIEKLLVLYENDADAGLHAAAEWLLRKWGQAEAVQTVVNKLRVNEQELRSRQPTDQRQWYVNSQGQTFVILDAGEFRMGSLLSDPEREADETPHLRRVGRTLAIAAKEVTKEEYRRFLEANPKVEQFDIEQYSRTGDSPQLIVDWYSSAWYCNWLSKNEGLPEDQWCYEPNKEGEFGEGMQPTADFLNRTGYRLPTESEWEFACRAKAVTSRYYGASMALLPKYAWAIENFPNYARPTGLLKPNDFGLFDALGNVLEWCQDAYGGYPVTDIDDAVNDDGDKKTVEEKYSRIARGSSYLGPATSIRSACRVRGRPGVSNYDMGFRPVRTYRRAP